VSTNRQGVPGTKRIALPLSEAAVVNKRSAEAAAPLPFGTTFQ
jgi:hypothetical protein